MRTSVRTMDRTRLEELIARGATLQQIADGAGVHFSTLRRWLRRYGLTTQRMAVRETSRDARVSGAATLLRSCSRHGIVEHVRDVRGSYRCPRCNGERVAQRRRPRPRHVVRSRGGSVSTTLPRVTRTCSRHGETTFAVRSDGRGYRRLRCRSEAVTRRRRRVKALLVQEAGGACVVCGYNHHPAALEFHHVDRADKAFAMSDGGVARSLRLAQAEAAKCVLLCANCHAEVEAGVATISSLPIQSR
jgi:predicted Zn-ribbon and HTH transcriptional regulator